MARALLLVSLQQRNEATKEEEAHHEVGLEVLKHQA